jgi:isoquinoline 1-oxidoreductase beta subunit
MLNHNLSRRTFLKVSTIAGTGVMVGCSFQSNPNISTPNAKSEDLGLWIRISNDDSITIISPTSELGQGTHTAHAMIIAEELEADWNKIKVVTAPARSEYKKNLYLQSTSANDGITTWWDRLAEIGAGTREILVEAGAQKMGVPKTECEVQDGHVFHRKSSRKMSYGQLAKTASKLDPPSTPKLKSRDKYRFIGKAMPRIDIPAKVNGSAVYGTDVRLPGMRYAAVSLAPVFGGEVKAYDKAAAMAVKGVENIVPIPQGISVIADSTWHAQKGLEALKVQFEGGVTVGLGSEDIDNRFKTSLDDMGKTELSGEKVLDLEYEIQFLSHAAIEPINCTAFVSDNFCEVWGPFQNQTNTLKKVKEITGLSEDQILVQTTYAGGGFGRKTKTDFSEQAVIISMTIKKPVQVMWSREEDMQHDFYHPASKSRFQISLGGDGMPLQWDNQYAASSQMAQDYKFLKWMDINLISYFSTAHSDFLIPKIFPKVMGYDWDIKPHYDIKGVDFKSSIVEVDIPLGFWRGWMFQNTFFLESAIDESAYRAGEDQFDYRIKLLSKSPRHKKVLERVAEESKWGSPVTEGHGRGIAICDFAGSILAEVAEVSVNNRGKLVVHRVDCVIDLGRYVNPDIVKSQVEGCVITGISIVTKEQITIENGRVEQSNFDDYRIARLKDTPKINVTIIDSEFKPTGADAGLAPTLPAITNAIFAATGKRIRKLPIGKQKLV